MNSPSTRVQRRPVHGVLLLDKPLGLSSNQALQKAKWLLRAEKAGHTGTLDPLASGVLPLCFGAATKFSQLHLDADKTYEATIALGIKTSTGDAEGDVIETRPVQCNLLQVQAVIEKFTGPIQQIPPMHSALKKDGKALYEYARAGQVVERQARSVLIHSLHLLQAELQGPEPFLRIRVQCSKGTYIRTLGEDMAEVLGCGGHLIALRRVATGPFVAEQCVSLTDLELLSEEKRNSQLRPVEILLQGHTEVSLDAENSGRFLSGVRRRGQWPDDEQVQVYGQEPRALLGTAHVKAGELIPWRLLSPIEIQQILKTPLVASPTRVDQA